MNERLGGVGRVIVGNVAYPNAWAEPGKTYRQVTCPICLDTGREFTDDGPLGPVCDCTFGQEIADAAQPAPRALCRAVCPSHQWSCAQTGEHGNGGHICYQDGRAHNFYAEATA